MARLTKICVVLIMLLFSQLSFAQDHRIVFSENFRNDNNGWPIQSAENYNFSLKGRKYDMNSSMEIMIAPVVKTIFDHNKDYTISCILNQISGISESGYGLTFSYKSSGNDYQLELASQGYYRVIRSQDDAITQVIPWTASDAIVKEDGKPNKLAIHKKGSICEIFINDVLVNSFDNFESEGDFTGFNIDGKHHVTASLLTIQYD